MAAKSAEGDLGAFEALLRQIHAPLFAFLHLLEIPDAGIEDVAQETALMIHKSIQRFNPAEDFLPWMRGIARNMAANYWRSHGREQRKRSVFREKKFSDTQLF